MKNYEDTHSTALLPVPEEVRRAVAQRRARERQRFLADLTWFEPLQLPSQKEPEPTANPQPQAPRRRTSLGRHLAYRAATGRRARSPGLRPLLWLRRR